MCIWRVGAVAVAEREETQGPLSLNRTRGIQQRSYLGAISAAHTSGEKRRQLGLVIRELRSLAEQLPLPRHNYVITTAVVGLSTINLTTCIPSDDLERTISMILS
jgi:hypothetical protein